MINYISMKSLATQIEFIDKKILPVFGVKNIVDYEKNILVEEFDEDLLK